MVVVVDRLLIGSLRFVLDKVASAVESELDDSEVLKEQLLTAQMRHELGEIDEEELARTEADVMARLRELKREEGAAGPISFSSGAGVDVSFGGDDDD